jgi:predicted PurR-regulated permease PerM
MFPLSFFKTKKSYQTVLLYFFSIIALFLASDLVAAVLVGAFFAYLTETMMNDFFKKFSLNIGAKWTFATCLISLILILLVLPILLLVRSALGEVIAFLSLHESRRNNTIQLFENFSEQVHSFLFEYGIEMSVHEISQKFTQGFRNLLNSLLNSLSQAFLATPAALIQIFFFVLSWGFFIVHGSDFRQKSLKYIMPFSETRELISRISHDVVRALVISTVVISLFHTLLYFIGFWIVGIPKILLWVVITFFCSWIPVIGTLPVALASIGYLYNQERYGSAVFILLIALTVGVSDNFIRPFFFSRGSTMRMSFFWSLIALVGGMQKFGLVGLILGPVIFATVYGLMEEFETEKHQKNVFIKEDKQKE